jgi:hypothetical protein
MAAQAPACTMASSNAAPSQALTAAAISVSSSAHSSTEQMRCR